MPELGDARYVSLTTFKKDGSSIATPVWITGSDGSYAFTTGDKAWKTVRLRNNPSVRVQLCDLRGRVKPNAEVCSGTGEVHASPEAIGAAERALAAKYGWQFKATKLVDGFKTRFGRGPKQAVVAIHLSLDSSAGTPRIQPFLQYRDVAAAVECLTQAFGFRVEQAESGPDGTLEHAVLNLYDGRVMARRSSDTKQPSGSLTYVYVDDVDAHFGIASDAGIAEILSEPADQPWGDRVYDVRDVGGHHWTFAQRLATRL